MKELRKCEDPLHLIEKLMQIYHSIGELFTSYKQYDMISEMERRDMAFE